MELDFTFIWSPVFVILLSSSSFEEKEEEEEGKKKYVYDFKKI